MIDFMALIKLKDILEYYSLNENIHKHVSNVQKNQYQFCHIAVRYEVWQPMVLATDNVCFITAYLPPCLLL